MKRQLSVLLLLTFFGCFFPSGRALAQDPFIGEIRMFAGNFAPRGWAFCDGQLLSVSQNDTLFAILGTTYGGDGRVTFALPDLRGRAPIHAGQGPGLSNRPLGQRGGQENVVLGVHQMPAHNHALGAISAFPDDVSPEGSLLATKNRTKQYASGTPDVSMDKDSIDYSGSGQAHDNMQPYIAINYIIALQGIFPPRN